MLSIHTRSKNTFAFAIVYLVASTLSFTVASAHDIEVHKEITRRAISQTYSLPDFLTNVFGYDAAGMPKDPKFGQFTGSGWIVEGSEREDDDIRSFNHFYDPIDKKGLTDFIVPIPFPNAYTYGFSSFIWATTPASVFADVNMDPNYWNWPQARVYEYAALTSSSKSDRDKYFGYMFRAVGQVVHLLEDTSQPEHVRNTEHLSYFPPLHSYLEEYGKANYPKLFNNPEAYYRANVLPYPSTQDGLKSLWDRNVLSSGLSDTGTSDSLLGLAEFSNKNYLGIRSLYGEVWSPSGLHHYAHPSLNETNVRTVVEAFGTVGVNSTADKDGVVRNGIYISKVTNGLKVRCHSRLTYLGSAMSNFEIGVTSGTASVNGYDAVFTIHDHLVAKEYLEVLLPTAVSYATACLDYFFRGGMEASARYDINLHKIAITIRNTSNCTFDDGEFELYWDDESGVRTKLNSFSAPGHMEPNGHVVGTMHAPPGAIKVRNCTVVYKGKITPSGGGSDPVDDNIAVAACNMVLTGSAQIADRFPSINLQFANVASMQTTPPSDVSAINSTLSFDLTGLYYGSPYTTPGEPSASFMYTYNGNIEFLSHGTLVQPQISLFVSMQDYWAVNSVPEVLCTVYVFAGNNHSVFYGGSVDPFPLMTVTENDLTIDSIYEYNIGYDGTVEVLLDVSQ